MIHYFELEASNHKSYILSAFNHHYNEGNYLCVLNQVHDGVDC